MINQKIDQNHYTFIIFLTLPGANIPHPTSRNPSSVKFINISKVSRATQKLICRTKVKSA